jgi:hypothetical protein
MAMRQARSRSSLPVEGVPVAVAMGVLVIVIVPVEVGVSVEVGAAVEVAAGGVLVHVVIPVWTLMKCVSGLGAPALEASAGRMSAPSTHATKSVTTRNPVYEVPHCFFDSPIINSPLSSTLSISIPNNVFPCLPHSPCRHGETLLGIT